MKTIIILVSFLISISLYADNNPFYTQKNIDDIRFSIQDIANHVHSNCDITLTEQKLAIGVRSHANFNCTEFGFDINRTITWDGIPGKDLSQLIKDVYRDLKIKSPILSDVKSFY